MLHVGDGQQLLCSVPGSSKISVGKLQKISNETLSKSFTQVGKNTTSEVEWSELK